MPASQITFKTRSMLLGALGDGEPSQLDKEIDGLLLRSPTPDSSTVASFLQLYTGEARNAAARRLVERGVSANAVASALTWLDAESRINTKTIGNVLTVASAAASAWHGYRRNSSIGWGIWWFFCGIVFPVFTPVIGLAQGFGKKKGS